MAGSRAMRLSDFAVVMTPDVVASVPNLPKIAAGALTKAVATLLTTSQARPISRLTYARVNMTSSETWAPTPLT